MSTKFFKSGNIEIEKQRFCSFKSPMNIEDFSDI